MDNINNSIMNDGEIMREEYHSKHIEYIGMGITQAVFYGDVLQ